MAMDNTVMGALAAMGGAIVTAFAPLIVAHRSRGSFEDWKNVAADTHMSPRMKRQAEAELVRRLGPSASRKKLELVMGWGYLITSVIVALVIVLTAVADPPTAPSVWGYGGLAIASFLLGAFLVAEASNERAANREEHAKTIRSMLN